MITFFRLKAEGFKPIGLLDLPLNTRDITLIKGANGYGKSTILDALVWGLYGKSIKEVSDVRTLPKFWQGVYMGVKVEVYFQKDSEVYRVIRCYSYKGKLEDGLVGGNRLIVARDGESIDIKGKPQIQAYLEDKLGMSYTLFMNSIVFGQGLTRLIQESNADKKRIFVDAFNLQFLDKAKELANGQYKSYQSEYGSYLSKKSQIEDTLNSLTRTYNNIKHDREVAKNDTSNIISRQHALIKEWTQKLETLKSKKLKDPSEELHSLSEKISQLRIELSKKKKLSNVSLEDFVNQLYKLWKAKKYKELGKSLKDLYQNMKDKSSLEEQISELGDKMDDLKDQKYKYLENKNAISRCQDNIESAEDKIKSLKKVTKNKSDLKTLNLDISKKKAELGNLEEENKDLKSLMDNYEWLINDPLSNSGIKAYLFDSCLEKLNAALDSYSSLLGFRILFFIDLNTTRKDFDTVIEKEGEKFLYDELSGGEKQLVNVAIAFAMNIALTESRGLNIIFLDEVFESLDKDNVEIVINLIENILQDKTVFLISHHDSLPIHNSKTLQVEKINGLSYYKVL